MAKPQPLRYSITLVLKAPKGIVAHEVVKIFRDDEYDPQALFQDLLAATHDEMKHIDRREEDD